MLGHGVGALAELAQVVGEAAEEIRGEVAEGDVGAYFLYLPDGSHHVLLGGGAAGGIGHGFDGEGDELQGVGDPTGADVLAEHGKGDFDPGLPQCEFRLLDLEHEGVEEDVYVLPARHSHGLRLPSVPTCGRYVDSGGEVGLPSGLPCFELHEGASGLSGEVFAVVDKPVSDFFHLFCVLIANLRIKGYICGSFQDNEKFL